jgi:hypothetical protein
MHTIRLRGPWQLEPIERYIPRSDDHFDRVGDDLPSSSRAAMPADWAGVFGRDFLGRVRYHRVFQKPTGLDSGERVRLVIEPPRTRGVVTLSGTPLGQVAWGGPLGRFDITNLLEDHNRLEIVVEHPALDEVLCPNEDWFTTRPGGLVGEVRLEIEE